MIYLELFTTFFMIGLFTIGGGYAMLSLIQAQVVTIHNWIDEKTFTDIVAISQMTPGPVGINSATYVGYTVVQQTGASEFMSILGSFCATVAVVLPSFIIVLGICRMYSRFKNNSVFEGLMSGIKPAVAGLIGAAAIILMTKENFPDWKSWVLFAAAFAGALLGFLWYNCYPAQVFMGDTGSLAIGGIIAVFALSIRKELLLPLLCGIFLVEAVSVIIQRGWFKYTKHKYGEGRRVFLMAPIHHHYQKKGFFESKIVVRFWIVQLLLAAITLATLKIR